MSPNSVTLRDVALRAGVSTATVSLALREHPKISAERRRQIRQIADEMEYHPNPMATALVRRREHARSHPVCAEVAWIHQWAEPARLRGFREFDAYWRGSFEAAEQLGFRLEEFAIGPNLSIPRLVHVLASRNIQGILLPPHGGAAGRMVDWTGFPWEEFSVVRFGTSLTDPPAHVVTANQILGSLQAFANIRRNGYRRVGFFTTSQLYTRFFAGFLMAQAEVAADEQVPPLSLELATIRPGVVRCIRRWIEAHQPDAILTDCAEIRALLAEIGLRVPEDIGLATLTVLDGNADAGIFQDSVEVGRVAVETLLALMYANRRGIPERYRETLVEGWWQDGKSLPPKPPKKRNKV